MAAPTARADDDSPVLCQAILSCSTSLLRLVVLGGVREAAWTGSTARAPVCGVPSASSIYGGGLRVACRIQLGRQSALGMVCTAFCWSPGVVVHKSGCMCMASRSHCVMVADRQTEIVRGCSRRVEWLPGLQCSLPACLSHLGVVPWPCRGAHKCECAPRSLGKLRLSLSVSLPGAVVSLSPSFSLFLGVGQQG
jgi:hypothetical protein